MNIVEMENVVKRYQQTLALDHFNLQVQAGEIYGLLGPNGSGKTTAINCLLSLLKFEKGSIKIFGQPMSPDNYGVKRRIGLVMQNVGVYDELTVYENIDYFCSLYIDNSKQRKDLVQQAIEFVELEDFVKYRPQKLSGGLLRRLNLACGIAHQPELIILDEPTVAVDPQSRNKILQGIKDLRNQGKTIIYTTHYMEEVEALCDSITIMDRGKELVSGTSEQIKALSVSGDVVQVESYALPEGFIQELSQFPGVQSVQPLDKGLEIRFEKNSQQIVPLIHHFDQAQIDILNLTIQKPSLNDVFLEITGKELRDHA
ncbi:ABC-2 type transport system ATP-binding protein [Ignavigranum ruoffiae]|uniref:ABC-2 type transport system ATP-binding protein n=1 Tax=Ignavigranum ruoffiae TaxID=89093 RepID=A0A1H9ELC3_9LACT|nr:ABC transporter ATP-binding protein [Ignavigranum ruoffiae]SEQ26520.1 ABC-2 type transport system ATP-binding protein [Ignavigranum ruoffiae]